MNTYLIGVGIAFLVILIILSVHRDEVYDIYDTPVVSLFVIIVSLFSWVSLVYIAMNAVLRALGITKGKDEL